MEIETLTITKKVIKAGCGLSVGLPKNICDTLDIHPGSLVEVTIKNTNRIVAPCNRGVRAKKTKEEEIKKSESEVSEEVKEEPKSETNLVEDLEKEFVDKYKLAEVISQKAELEVEYHNKGISLDRIQELTIDLP